jgi:hypothetical protein
MAEMERNTAVEVGYRLPGGLLIEQANATKTIALADMPALKAESLLGDQDITNLDELVGQVHKGLEDRTTAASEARAQTVGQAAAMHDLKADRRRLGHCVERAFRNKPELAQYRQNSYRGTSVAGTCNDVNVKLAFAKEHQTELLPAGVTPAFLGKVEAEVRALEQSSGAQDAALTQLPESTRTFCEAKGRLYNAIKDINAAGHALHSADLEKAAKYNLKELYRKRGGAKAKPDANGGTTGGTPTK